MSRSNVNLLDLPDEILLLILKKLNNIDVLYSFIDVNNDHLNSLAREKIFSDTLNIVPIDNVSAIDQQKLDRFCKVILPKIHDNVKCFILEPLSMECILLAADYPSLIELKLFNFTQEIYLNYFTNESSLRYIFQQKLTHLTLVNIDKRTEIESLKNYNRNVYEHIMKFFRNLKYLSIIETHYRSYPPLLLYNSPSISFSSTILAYLCINVNTFDDCLYLLDGRLKQLTTLIVQIYKTSKSSSVTPNMDNLPNLKYFSLKCYFLLDIYDEKILPLLHHMTYLEKLTLYLCIQSRGTFIDRSHLQNEILLYIPHLHSFTFYISTYDLATDLFRYVPGHDIQRIDANIGYEQYMAKMINYINIDEAVCTIFSLPFAFHRIRAVGNIFPDIVFKYVTILVVHDIVPFNHEFFLRVSRSFPLLQTLHVINLISQSSCDINSFLSYDSQSCSIAKYLHLTTFNVRRGNINNVEEFLNETKTSIPCLTKLMIKYNDLRIVTKNFTREETRHNCSLGNLHSLI
ncbi:unnamed protein product [Rotaria sp. Silwood2]|nr:unnamed protein product [Rotaria sp. Silwood2]